MAMIPFYCFLEDLAEQKHNLASDTLKIALTNTAPNLTDTQFSAITEIAAGNGYTAGGAGVTVSSSAQTAGVYKLIIGDVTITAAGGSIGPFRYGVLYNDTHVDKPLIGYFDYGIGYTLPDTEPFVFDFDAAGGVFTIG